MIRRPSSGDGTRPLVHCLDSASLVSPRPRPRGQRLTLGSEMDPPAAAMQAAAVRTPTTAEAARAAAPVARMRSARAGARAESAPIVHSTSPTGPLLSRGPSYLPPSTA